MTSQNEFLAALAMQCAGLRTNIAEEYQTSIASLESRLRSLSAENDELRMQVKRLPSSARTAQERSSQERSDDTEEKVAVPLFEQEVEVPVPTNERAPRITPPTVMITSGAGNPIMHVEDVEDCDESSRKAGTSIKNGDTVKMVSVPGYIDSAQGNMDVVDSLLSPYPSDAQEAEGPTVEMANTPKAIEDSEHKHQNRIARQNSSSISSVPGRTAQDKAYSRAAAVRRGASSNSRRPEDEENDQVKVRCAAFAVESDDGQNDEDDDDDKPAQALESSVDSDASSNSDMSGNSSDEAGEQYGLADVWAQQNSDTVAARSSRAVMGSMTSEPISEPKTAVDYDVTQERSKPSAMAPLSRFIEKRCMLHPYSRQHVVWETLGLLLLLYDMTVVPLAIFEPDETDFTSLMTWAVRTFWTIDIAVSFLTGYLDQEGITVMTLHKVARNYSRTQLPLDLIVVLFDWLDAIIGVRATGVMKGGRVLRIMRLLRMRKARQLWIKLSEYVNADKALVFLKTGTNLSLLLLLLHFVACFWWGIGLLEIDSGKGWIAKGGFSSFSIGEKYLMSAHMGLANFYGEILYLPETVAESIYSLVLLYFAFICQMWMVSSITTAMTHLEIVSSKRTHMFTALDKFMTSHQVSRELRLKVHRSARHALLTKDQHTSESDIELLQLISQPMMIRLHVQMYAPILKAFPYLRCFMLADGAAARQLCHSAVTVDQCDKDDVIFAFQEKPVCGKVRFVSSGDLLYEDAAKNGRTLSPTDWLSEMVLWTDDWFHHRGTARARSDCRVVCLDADMFRKRVGSLAIGSSARVYARLRLNQVNGDPDSVSDLGTCDSDMDRILGLVFPEIWQTVSYEYLKGSTETAGMAAKLRTSSALLGRYSAVAPAMK
eukprot:TRINITY_DN16016_c4_g1_i1.p1 TRINITY_DN16016_c4_g1~~TRINITY_DN16016_c4_g1_i1.p1  ORF type:complete len:885 (-),score=142.70 TRINITY_DN16016_c4_g1_i1:82-2736(-)